MGSMNSTIKFHNKEKLFFRVETVVNYNKVPSIIHQSSELLESKLYKYHKTMNISNLQVVSMIPSNPKGLLDVYNYSDIFGGFLWKIL